MRAIEVMDLTTVCQDFPQMPEPEISRENHLQTIESIFQGGIKIIFIEGEEGIGKTTLLGRFALHHPKHTFSLFIRPGERWSSDPAMLKLNFCNQLEWALYERELQGDGNIDDGFLRSRIFQLTKRARRERFFFVIDGLFESDSSSQDLQNQVLDWLPIGNNNFYFLISGDSITLPPSLRERYSHKSYPVSFVNASDTTWYLQQIGCDVDLECANEIHKICRGLPGRLTIVRRILETTDLQTLISKMPEQLVDLFEIEWRAVNTNDRQQQLLIALIAHDRKTKKLTQLAHLLNMTMAEISGLIKPIRFIYVDPDTHDVAFVPDSFRAFAAQRLHEYKTPVYDLIIENLFRTPDSEDSTVLLPQYLSQAGRYDDLLTYLTPEAFDRIITHSQSLIPIRNQAELGVSAARKRERVGELVKFGLYKSVSAELNAVEVLRSEVEAYMGLGNETAALDLAHSAVLTEDRLHLLAVIARIKQEKSEPLLDSELLQEIRQLYGRLDYTALGERATEIAADLIYSSPDLAIEIVENSSRTPLTSEQPDWAFANLTFAAAQAEQEEELSPITAKILERIKNPKTRQILAAASAFVGNCSASRIIKEVQELEVPEQMTLLRQWALRNRERADAADVVEYAFQLAIRATEQTITARDFRELATPLPFIPNCEKAKQLVGAFDSQQGAIQRLSSSVDYVRMQLILAQTEIRYAPLAAHNRILEVYLYNIDDIGDLVTKTECLARLVAALTEMNTGILPEAQIDLDQAVKLLLKVSAEHYYAVRGVIRALAKSKPNLAYEYARSLNTEYRRDLALSDLVESYIQNKAEHIDFDLIDFFLDKIVDNSRKDKLLVVIVDRLEKSKDATIVPKALPLICKIRDIQNLNLRCQACCLSISILHLDETGRYESLMKQQLEQLTQSWDQLDVGWVKVDVGFQIVKSLTTLSKDSASDFLEMNEQYRQKAILTADNSANAYIASLRLAIRAYAGLLPRQLTIPQDQELLKRLIDVVPSCGERSSLWADVALYHYLHNDNESCRRIVNENIRPLFDNVENADGEYRNQLLVATSPALYCANPLNALDSISQLSSRYRDQAYGQILRFITTRVLPHDPHDPVDNELELDYDLILESLKIIELMEYDHLIYSSIESIVASAVSRQSSITRQQKTEIARRLVILVDAKFPSVRFITHQGYKIAALAQIARLRQTKLEEWQSLANDAEQTIDNLADQVLVICIIAMAVPKKTEIFRKSLLAKVRSLVEQIPSALDQAIRYLDLSKMLIGANDIAAAREYVELAMKVASEDSQPHLYPLQQRVIDLAYRIDPEGDFAQTLAGMADDDPVRERARTRLNHHLDILRLKRLVVNESHPSTDPTRNAKDYAQVAWMRLGALNAGQNATIHINDTQEMALTASKLSFSHSYPIYAWLIENVVRRYTDTPDAAVLIRPLFEAALKNTQLIFRIAECSISRIVHSRSYFIADTSITSATTIEIKSGEREQAIAVLRDWFEHGVQDYLKIIDEYFGPQDMEILLLLKSIKPSCKVKVLTSRKHQLQDSVEQPWDEAYRNYWRQHISVDQYPPETEITVCGRKSDQKSPIHDRRWLTNGSGLRIGSSFNSLGISQSTEISYYSAEEAKQLEESADRYLTDHIREDNQGEKIDYLSFFLP